MSVQLMHGDCLERMGEIADGSVDAIITDPPYYKVKRNDWDNQWASKDKFIDWIGQLCKEFYRVLKPNGSLYLFASSQMSASVECKITDTFNVLNRITWIKNDGNVENSGGRWRQSCKESLRSYFPRTESIIFAEHYGSDNIAKGEAGYNAKCDELRGFIFEPIRAYLSNARDLARWTTRGVAKQIQKETGSRTVSGMARHWFEQSQWQLPTKTNYEWLQRLLSKGNLHREYEDLRHEYEDLRHEYEDLRRPFSVTKEVPYTDVWTFPVVSPYPGRHPCEKPVLLISHMIKASTRDGRIILDPFMGSGTTGVACINTGRSFIGIELDETYFATSQKRIAEAIATQAELLPFACNA